MASEKEHHNKKEEKKGEKVKLKVAKTAKVTSVKVTKPTAKRAIRKIATTQKRAKKSPAMEQETGIIAIRINGQLRKFIAGHDIEPWMTLSYFLKERLGFTGLKVSCDEGACGACTIIMDGKAVLSCMMLAIEADGHEILTIEGLPKDDPVILAFAEQHEPGYGTALQCGYCTPGFVMAARALLNENPKPTLDEIKEALSGNLCRCGCYAGIAQAVWHASEKMQAKGGVQ